MSGGLIPATRERWLAPVLLGGWAAAVALAPGVWWKALLAAPALLVPVAFWVLEKPVRWVHAFLAAALLLPPLPIALGNSGPHLSLAFAALGLLAGALWLPRWRIPFSGLTAALPAFTAVLLASVAAALVYSGPTIAAASLARVALFGISVYIFFYTAYGPGKSAESMQWIRPLFWIAAASALFASLDFYFQFPAPAGFGAQFVWLDSGVYRRAQGVFYEASTLGNFCAFFLILIAVCWARPRAEAPLSRKALAAGGVLFLAALVLSYSRSSLLNLITALLVLAWLNRKRLPVGRILAMGIPGISAAVWLIWKLFPSFLESYGLRLSNTAQYLFTATNGVLSGRLSSWQILVDWMAAHPWQTLLGIGYKTLPYTNTVGVPVVGDNTYLTLLVETGILGLAALFWLNFAILRSAGRAVRGPNAGASFYGTWMLCFWCGEIVQMLSGDLLTYWRLLPVYFWVLALAVRA